jgi:glycerophosphoryl diester phosphodiesterase
MNAQPEQKPQIIRRRLAPAALALAALIGGGVFFWFDSAQRAPRPARPALVPGPRPANMAHRGASGCAPENTLSAFELAVQQGADWLELDVHKTRDGVVVVLHDDSLARTTGIEADVRHLTYAELQKINAAGAFQSDCIAPDAVQRFRAANLRVPTLAEVFAAFPKQRINIEIKQNEPHMETDLVRVIDAAKSADRVIVAAVKTEAIQRFREASGGRIATSASLGETTRLYACYLSGWPCNPDYDLLQLPAQPFWGVDLSKAEFIRFARGEYGLQAHYWTVNDEAEMRRLLANGADGIMTDFPDRLTRVLDARAAAETR